MYYHHWGHDHGYYQEQQYRATQRTPSPERDILLQARKRRFDDESESRALHVCSEHDTLPRSPPRAHKQSRLEGYETLPLRPRIPAPLSADAARQLGIMKGNPGQENPQWMTSSVPERQKQGKLPSDDMRREDRNQAGSERQYGQQSNAAATFRGRRVGVLPAVSSEFGLPFKISSKKIRTRCLPSAIEVSERGSDSAYYLKTPIIIREPDVSMSKLEMTTPKTATGGRAANAKYGFELSQQAPTTGLAQPPVGINSVFSNIASSVPTVGRNLETRTSAHDKFSAQRGRHQETVAQSRAEFNDIENALGDPRPITSESSASRIARTEEVVHGVTSDKDGQKLSQPQGPKREKLSVRQVIARQQMKSKAKAAAKAAEALS